MAMNITGLKAYKEIQSIVTPKETQATEAPVKGQPKEGFAQFLKDAIHDVNNVQATAEDRVEGLITKKPGYTNHEAMIALEKADIAFQLMNSVRSKIVRAYEEILRTQV